MHNSDTEWGTNNRNWISLRLIINFFFILVEHTLWIWNSLSIGCSSCSCLKVIISNFPYMVYVFCINALIQHRMTSVNVVLGERGLSRVVPDYSHIPALLPSPSTQRESLSDTACETVHIPSPKPHFFPLHHFQMCQHIKRAPQPGFSLRKITWFLVCVQLCDTKIAKVCKFQTVWFSMVCLYLRQCQLI